MFRRNFEPQGGRKQSLDDINLDQFLKIANYEDTVKELDVYYGIGNICFLIFDLFVKIVDALIKLNFHFFSSVKRQLLQFQSPISGLFPVLSTDTEVGSVRDSVYCAAAVWSLYQAYRRIDDDRGKSHELGTCIFIVLCDVFKHTEKFDTIM